MTSRMSFFDYETATSDECSSGYMVVSLSGQSYKVKTLDIAKQVAAEFMSSLGTMASRSQHEYALSCHDHDIYTCMKWSQNSTMSVCQLLNVHDITNDASYAISAGGISPESFIEISDKAKDRISSLQPKIGEVRLFNSAMPDYTQNDFNGWVLANGSTYHLSDFLLSDDITTVFGVINDDSYCVMNFCEQFVKFETNLNAKTTFNSGISCLVEHTHRPVNNVDKPYISAESISIGSHSTLTSPMKLKGKTYGNSMHVGGAFSKTVQINAVKDGVNITLGNGTSWITAAEKNVGKMPQPKSVTLIPYVYVGRSLSSAPLYDF